MYTYSTKEPVPRASQCRGFYEVTKIYVSTKEAVPRASQCRVEFDCTSNENFVTKYFPKT